MSSLTDKLKELGVQVGASNIQTPARSESRRKLLDVFDGSWEKTRQGDCFVVRKSYPLSTQHGARTLSQDIQLKAFAALPGLEEVSNLNLENLLFIDTETTGLSGGAGTYVFLIGAARIRSDQIEFVQFFLQDPGSESAQLSALEDFAASAELIVSYNGKSFDLPRIKTRYRFHSWLSPFENILHIDLLHIVRRLWKRHLPGCTLGDLEHHILSLERSSLDIPGWQVSEKFFDYLQTGDPEPLESVFYHNEVDVISLIGLTSYISDRVCDPLSESYRGRPDQVSVGEYLKHIDQPHSREVLTEALKLQDLEPAVRISGLLSLADIYKKRGEYSHSLPLWKECADHNDLQSHLELAMYFEHREMDIQEAIHWTLAALEIINLSSGELDLTWREKLEYRLARLKRKSGPF